MILDHVLHVRAVERGGVQLLHLLQVHLVLLVQGCGHLDALGSGQSPELVVGLAVVRHHALPELPHLFAGGVRRGIGAELDLQHSALGSLVDELAVRRGQRDRREADRERNLARAMVCHRDSP
ncbi:MAG TPA: hypothetical protein VFV75_03465 [Candidatus Polarisedimenticolaceae bacterium]|nr:hypothetical protein [Candidatus Polarisedimenticolaceae bacterium]